MDWFEKHKEQEKRETIRAVAGMLILIVLGVIFLQWLGSLGWPW